MSHCSFDPDSPGARRLIEFAASAREWGETVLVVGRAGACLIDQGDDYSLEPGQRAEVPAAWAKSLVARGASSYVS